jgi:hypothetical protein
MGLKAAKHAIPHKRGRVFAVPGQRQYPPPPPRCAAADHLGLKPCVARLLLLAAPYGSEWMFLQSADGFSP